MRAETPGSHERNAMIDRYTRPKMGHIFSLENKYAIWQEIEVLACEAHAEMGKIGITREEAQWIRDHAAFNKEEVDEIEAKAMGIFETNETAHRGRRQKPKSVVESKGKINLELQQKAQHQAKTKAIFMSLDNEKNVGEEAWSETEIEQMPHKLFEELFSHVRRLSGIELSEDEVDTFH